MSWYRPHLERSLALIRATGAPHSARILDVGGGASTLVDDLLAARFEAITVLDVSREALAAVRDRLGRDAAKVRWVEGDITRVDLAPGSIDIWHDRAMLHFLTDASRRRAYIAQLRHALADGGHAILSTFAPEGPKQCSNLPVLRYDAEALQELVGGQFVLRQARGERHRTPSGGTQPFTCCWFSYHLGPPRSGRRDERPRGCLRPVLATRDRVCAVG